MRCCNVNEVAFITFNSGVSKSSFIMFKHKLISCILLLCCSIAAVEICPLKTCDDRSLKSQYVEDYCMYKNATMVGRCCMRNKTKSDIIGLDLRNCSLTVMNITQKIFEDVEIIDLRENKLKYVTKAEFIGLVQLEALYLPPIYTCPGSEDAWNNVLHTENETQCLKQLNPCAYLNVSCSVNGMCLHIGPGSAKCVCLPDHHGYKCLEQGEFPMTVFIISLCIPTVLLSMILWYYHRYDVGKED